MNRRTGILPISIFFTRSSARAGLFVYQLKTADAAAVKLLRKQFKSAVIELVGADAK